MKKKLFFLITVLLEVFFFAQGESENNMYGIKELQNQRRIWNESYEAKGRTVQVDIPIIIPEVEEFPVFSVEPYYAVYEQQHAIYRKLEFRYYIDKQKYEELKRFAVRPGEMIVSCSGTIGKTFVIPENAPEGVINQALLKLTPTSRINVFYLQYFFDNTISKILNSVARGGAIKNVPSVEELKAIKIPIPTLEVQQRLVEVLDNFEKICSDLNIGLPAEIEARQKQYEYYRDKLLTFKEVAAT